MISEFEGRPASRFLAAFPIVSVRYYGIYLDLIPLYSYSLNKAP
jgi:hypothetical protein